MERAGLQLACFALWTLLLIWRDSSGMNLHVRECPPGRFGHDCLYVCHCVEEGGCHPVNGSCGSRGCTKGYVGDSCQYVNLAFNANTSGAGSKPLIDGDPLTCIDLHVTHVHWVDLADKYWLRRFRVAATATAEHSKFNIGIGSSSDTKQELTSLDARITWSRDEGEADVFLKSATRARYVWIRGSNLLLCELYVYGGRNVALFRPTAQSSTSANLTSSLAVDGVTSRRLCTRTDKGDNFRELFKEREVWWRVNLTANHVITRVTIYNNDVALMRWFHLLVGYEEETSLRTVYQSPAISPPPLLDMIPVEPIPMALFQVQLYGKQRILTLCEVQLFGDCPDMMYGPACNSKCSCADKTEVCDSFSGACSSDISNPSVAKGEAETPTTGVDNVTRTVPVVVVLLVVFTSTTVTVVVVRRRTRSKVPERYTDAKTTLPSASTLAQADDTYEIMETAPDCHGNPNSLQPVSRKKQHASRDQNTPAKALKSRVTACGNFILRQKVKVMSGINNIRPREDKSSQPGSDATHTDTYIKPRDTTDCNSVHEYEDADSLGTGAARSGCGSNHYECLFDREYETPYTALGGACVPASSAEGKDVH